MNSDTNRSKRREHLAQEAADWVVALSGADSATRKAFADWLRESPEHIREFLAVSAIWSALPELPSQPSVEELVRLATEQPNVVALPAATAREAGRTPARPSSRRSWMGRAAAVFLLALGAVLALVLLPSGQDAGIHRTRIGEQASVPLPDGSLVNLNTRSEIRVAYSEGFRDIRLVEGEALFEAVRDASRPFRVITDQAVIVAVGTTFNVRADEDEVTVSVVEGVVDVSSGGIAAGSADRTELGPGGSEIASPVRLRVGQQAQVQAHSAPEILAEAPVERAIAWREHRLIFEASPLKQVIDEFNRYNAPPAVIADRELESLPISGVFRSHDRASFLEFLSQMELAESAIGEGGEIVLTTSSPD